MRADIDKRIGYKLVLDTETCPIDKDINSVDGHNMFVYDIGWVVTDKRGKIYASRSFVVKEIFEDEKLLMETAYYASKIPDYEKDIASGSRILAPLAHIWKVFKDDIKDYGIEECGAFNAMFDVSSMNNTLRFVTKSKNRYWFPYNVDIFDIMIMAREVILPTPTYRAFCIENGYMTKAKTPQPQIKAEVIHRYLTDNTSFEESHTGLEDVLIETNIMARCYAKKQKMRKILYERKTEEM